jgi:hypothetical protein
MIDLILTRPVHGKRLELPKAPRSGPHSPLCGNPASAPAESAQALRKVAHRFAAPCAVLAGLLYAAALILSLTGQPPLWSLIASAGGVAWSLAAVLAEIYPAAVRLFHERNRR